MTAQVLDVSVGKHIGTSNHISINFRIVMNEDGAGPQVQIQNWSGADIDGIR